VGPARRDIAKAAQPWFNPAVMAIAEQQGRYTFDRMTQIVFSLACAAALLWLVRYLADVLLPFAAAVVLAYLLNPLVCFLERKLKHRAPAVALTLGGLGVVGVLLALLLVPLVISQVRRFSDDLKKLHEDLSAGAETASAPAIDPPPSTQDVKADVDRSARSDVGWHELKEGWLEYRKDADRLPRSQRFTRLRENLSGTYLGGLLDRTVVYIQSEEFSQLVVRTAKRLAVGGWTVVTFAVEFFLGLTGLIIVLLYLVFLLLDYPEYARAWPTFVPEPYRDSVVEFAQELKVVTARYFRGQSVVALLVGTLFALGFALIGLPMAIPFGLFVGLLNMVPYLQTAALVPAIVLAGLRAIEGETSFLGSVGWVLLIFAVIQLLQEAIIVPRIMRGATGLRPVAIMLGLFIWGKLLGFLGLLLAIPLTCLGIAYYQRYVLKPSINKA